METKMEKFEKNPFSILIKEEQELIDLRKQSSEMTKAKRLLHADWVYNEEGANFLMANSLLSENNIKQDDWPAGIATLAINPTYAPAILTVGSIECQIGRIDEGLKLFLSLLDLDKKTDDLHIIIDKSGDCLLDSEEYDVAFKFYESAEKKYKNNILFLIGLGYSLGKLGEFKKAVEISSKIVKLKPNNYEYLSDLGYSLIETGEFKEAEVILKKAIELAPDDYKLAKGNLEYLFELQEK